MTTPGKRRVEKILSERYHGRDTGQARKWFQGGNGSFVKRRDQRAAILAGAAALVTAHDEPAADLSGLRALRRELSGMYSWERCGDCGRPGWAHSRPVTPRGVACDRWCVVRRRVGKQIHRMRRRRRRRFAEHGHE